MPTARAAGLLSRRSAALGRPEVAQGLLELSFKPSFPTEFVPRPALVSRLAEARDAALALIVAPPGYGKTSLLSEWADHDERTFLWLGFEPTEAEPDVENDVSELLALHRIDGGGVVTVLDDAHLVAAGTLRIVTEALFRALPHGSIVALASRTEPQLPTGRLRAHRSLIEIRRGDLALNAPQAARLLRQSGSELKDEVVGDLHQRTEGWPAALYLAALSINERPDAPGSPAPFRGDDHLVMEYLRDEILSALPEELTSFLARASVLDELSGPVCDAVLQESGAAQKLATLARFTELLEPLDPSHHGFRWHALFRDCMRGELRRLEPELERRLHRRASVWYSDQGNTQVAIDYACAARDAALAGDLLYRSIAVDLTCGRSEQLLSRLGAFSRDQIAASPTLAICAAFGCLAGGDVAQAHHWAAVATAAAVTATAAGASADRSSIEAGLAVLDATTARAGASGMRRAAARADGIASEGGRWRPVCLMLTGVAEHLLGDRVQAAVMLEDAADLAGRAMPSVTALCQAQRTMIAIECGDWELAEELADRAAATVAEHGLAHDPLTALVFAAAAAARAHQGRVDEAKHDLRASLDHLASLGEFVPWYGAEASILLAHAALWLADIVGARTLLAQASRLARRVPDAVIFERWFTEAWAQMDTLAEASLAGPSSLTIAELRVLRFLPSHRSFREIAAVLGVSANTVKSQAHAVYRKLGAASRSEAVARATDAGLLGQ